MFEVAKKGIGSNYDSRRSEGVHALAPCIVIGVSCTDASFSFSTAWIDLSRFNKLALPALIWALFCGGFSVADANYDARCTAVAWNFRGEQQAVWTDSKEVRSTAL